MLPTNIIDMSISSSLTSIECSILETNNFLLRCFIRAYHWGMTCLKIVVKERAQRFGNATNF